MDTRQIKREREGDKHEDNLCLWASMYTGKVRTKEGPVYVEAGWVCAVFLIKVFFVPFGFLFPVGLDPHLMAVRLGRRCHRRRSIPIL